MDINIKDKIKIYTNKLKNAENMNDANKYHRKLRYYRRLDQFGSLCTKSVLPSCRLKELLEYEPGNKMPFN